MFGAGQVGVGAGLRVLVTYEDDPGWHHERLLLWCVQRKRWVALTPDEVFDDYESAWLITGVDRYPTGAVNVVAFDDALEGSDVLRFIKDGSSRLHGWPLRKGSLLRHPIQSFWVGTERRRLCPVPARRRASPIASGASALGLGRRLRHLDWPRRRST